jgi:tetratricopeptide (TPR) repeat protein
VALFFLCRTSLCFGCGPDFPNTMLDLGDRAVLAAPLADFERELERTSLLKTRWRAVPPEGGSSRNGYAAQTQTTEADDLVAALKKRKTSGEEIAAIRKEHLKLREAIQTFLAEMGRSQDSRPWIWSAEGDHWGEPEIAPRAFPKIEVPKNLPEEFEVYLSGALLWHNPAITDKSPARTAWERLLELPAAERPYKSTWAAFMLGKSWEEADDEKAVQNFRLVRELASKGFADTCGLATASLGLEARTELRGKHYGKAVELYLEQLAAGDGTAVNSLRFVAAKTLEEASPGQLVALARNPRAQAVITAYLLSCRVWRSHDDEGTDTPSGDPAARWLVAVETAEVRDAAAAESLALAAYQRNDMRTAQRWLERATPSPTTQWLKAKLLLHSGKIREAAAQLSEAVRLFPIQPPDTNHLRPLELRESLYLGDGDGTRIPAAHQIRGELGVLMLARHEYIQSLDALLTGGFWMDAAYVAESVLTVDELKNYVDRNWPAVSDDQTTEEVERYKDARANSGHIRKEIRYLLARRLTRSMRGDEARPYYPIEWVPQFDALARALQAGWNESLPPEDRARNLFEAAIITRTNGMELIGTEAGPDWQMHAGNFDSGVTLESRPGPDTSNRLPIDEAETSRAMRHKADPERRFHYRYHAAALAWEAARLMPNDSDETAHVLWTAGCWLKNRDPETADVFYKALVNRNRKTALGAAADEQRWFPRLDEGGEIIPRKRSVFIPPQSSQ